MSSKKGGSRSSSKKAQKAGSNVFDMFTQKQVAEMKEGFQLMDRDKDGILGKADLRAIFDEIGRLATEEELDEMLGEAPGPINFTMFLNMFAERQTGEADDDELVRKSFMAYADDEGMVNADKFRHALMTWGDKFSGEEADSFLDEIDIDDNNMIDVADIVSMLTAGGGEDEE